MIYDNNVVLGQNTTNVVTGSGCTLTSNVLFPQSIPYPGNLLVDPQLVDVVGGDYHLKATSPAVDAASSTSDFPAITIDYDGQQRPQGAKNDIGAFERAP